MVGKGKGKRKMAGFWLRVGVEVYRTMCHRLRMRMGRRVHLPMRLRRISATRSISLGGGSLRRNLDEMLRSMLLRGARGGIGRILRWWMGIWRTVWVVNQGLRKMRGKVQSTNKSKSERKD
jgi:hypothetical protein